MQKNEVRIIAGLLKGRLVRFPSALALRPTPNRLKETLFNWLGQNLNGYCVLDLFSGSASLGFEAFSRGADCVYVNDSNKEVARAIYQNAQMFNLPRARFQVFQQDAFDLLNNWQEEKLDLVFLDPPFAKNWWQQFENLLPLLNENAIVYVENNAEVRQFFHLKRIKFSRAGQVYAHLFQNQ